MVNRRQWAIGATVLVVVALPVVLVGTATRIAASEWFVRLEYSRRSSDVPESRRLDLGLAGLRAIESDDVASLRRERLEGGPAFTEPELNHLEDVATALDRIYRAHLAASGVTLIGLAFVGLLAGRRAVARALGLGGLATLSIAAGVGLYALLDFHDFFERFHHLVFPQGNWRFRDSSTLIRLYPEEFWQDTAALLVALTVVQVLVLLGAWFWSRARIGERRAFAVGVEARR